MNNETLSSLHIGSAKEAIRITRYRDKVTEAEFYGLLSKFYDEVEETVSRKKLSTIGWALTSTGVTHLITAIISEIPDKGPILGISLQRFYALCAIALLIVGLVLVIISQVFPQSRCNVKENIITKHLKRELGNESSLYSEADLNAAQIADSSRDIT